MQQNKIGILPVPRRFIVRVLLSSFDWLRTFPKVRRGAA
jgi:hypothetical protein